MKTPHATRMFAFALALVLSIPAASATPRDPADAYVTSFSLSGTSFPSGGNLTVTANVTVPVGNLTGLSFGFYLANSTTLFTANWSGFGGSGTYGATYAFTGAETPGTYELVWIYTRSQNSTTPFSHQEYDNVTYPDGSPVRVSVGNSTTGAPDLIVSSLTLSPSAPQEGQSVTISGLVHNVGSAGAANSTVQIVLDGNATLGSRSVGGIPPGGNRSFTLNWTAVAGNHTITAIADAFNNVTESNEANNKATRNVSVSGSGSPGKPDLVAWLDPVWNRTEGEWTSLQGYVQNVGNATATDALAELYLDGQLLAAQTGTLAPGQTMQVSASWYATAGFHQLLVVADPYRSIDETNEGNNVAVAYFEVLPLVDVGIEIVGVRHEPLRTDLGEAPNPHPRHIVTVLVTNHENRTTSASVNLSAQATLRHLTVTTHAHAASAFVVLEPGEARVLELVWDPLVALGDVTLHARIDPHGIDRQWKDNEDTASDFVLVGGLGGVVVA